MTRSLSRRLPLQSPRLLGSRFRRGKGPREHNPEKPGHKHRQICVHTRDTYNKTRPIVCQKRWSRSRSRAVKAPTVVGKGNMHAVSVFPYMAWQSGRARYRYRIYIVDVEKIHTRDPDRIGKSRLVQKVRNASVSLDPFWRARFQVSLEQNWGIAHGRK